MISMGSSKRMRARHVPLALVVSLLFSLPGCSGYRAAVLPGVEYAGEAQGDAVELFVGQSARVTLKSGEQEVGEVVDISDAEITLGRPSNFGFQRIAISIVGIELVEVQQAGRMESVIYGVLIGASVLTALFFIMLRSAFSGMGST